jgi:WD40 repeat protein
MSKVWGRNTATRLADGRVLVLGADGGDLYDPKTGAFSATGAMTALRQGFTATLLADGRVLVAGGDGTSAEVYDPKTGAFSVTGAMTDIQIGFSATLLGDGQVLLVGGDEPVDGEWEICQEGAGCWRSTDLVPVGTAELYNPATGIFSRTGSMASPRDGSQSATLLADGRVLIAGGSTSSSGASVTSAELYDPKTGGFSATGSLIAGRRGHTGTLLSDGRVLIAGGEVELSGKPLATAELYDPKTATFSAAGPMTTARKGHTATLLSDGRVLITGGYDGTPASASGGSASAELHDPKTGTFARTGSMTAGRTGHSATLLSDGRVLVAGGSYEQTTQTAELYQP